jgi:NADP-reducing hydrogenase subunit HndB
MQIIKQKQLEANQRIMDKGYDSNFRVYVGMATCEIAAGSEDVMKVFKEALEGGLKDVYLSQKGCAGRCHLEPMVEISEVGKTPVKYCKVTEEKAKAIIERHIKNGEVITDWVIPN